MDDNLDFGVNERMCKSSSETLDRYIQNYEYQKQTRSLSLERPKQTLKIMDSLRRDMSALDEEIVLARQLFPEDSWNISVDDRSLTTEELLMEHTFNASFRSETPERLDRSSSLRVAEYQDDDFVSEQHRTDQYTRSRSSLSTIDNAGSCLRRLGSLVRDEKRTCSEEYQRPVSSTPATKFARSKIYSDDIEGELTVSMNYQPQNRNPRSHHIAHEQFDFQSSSDARICRYQPEEELNKEGHVTVSLQLEGKPAGVREFMGECFMEQSSSSSPKSPRNRASERTVESLKNMLFSLQEISKDAKNDLDKLGEQNETQSNDPGYESLQRAMKHLVILKDLVREVGRDGRREKK